MPEVAARSHRAPSQGRLNDTGLSAHLTGFTSAAAGTVGGREYFGPLPSSASRCFCQSSPPGLSSRSSCTATVTSTA